MATIENLSQKLAQATTAFLSAAERDQPAEARDALEAAIEAGMTQRMLRQEGYGHDFLKRAAQAEAARCLRWALSENWAPLWSHEHTPLAERLMRDSAFMDFRKSVEALAEGVSEHLTEKENERWAQMCEQMALACAESRSDDEFRKIDWIAPALTIASAGRLHASLSEADQAKLPRLSAIVEAAQLSEEVKAGKVQGAQEKGGRHGKGAFEGAPPAEARRARRV